MDPNISKYIEINKDRIAKVYNYQCSDGGYIVYIFFKETGRTNRELLWAAMENCDVNTIMVNDEVERIFTEEMGEYIEI
ncbi:MAG: hypothetical protein FWG68_02810 [Defluviitaleaceae bacterium]|nr:hypothetical protein [Defluviitaleaceae bacterium]